MGAVGLGGCPISMGLLAMPVGYGAVSEPVPGTPPGRIGSPVPLHPGYGGRSLLLAGNVVPILTTGAALGALAPSVAEPLAPGDVDEVETFMARGATASLTRGTVGRSRKLRAPAS